MGEMPTIPVRLRGNDRSVDTFMVGAKTISNSAGGYKDMQWNFRLAMDYIYPSGLCVQHDVAFKDKQDILRLKIASDGTITVMADYCWDGCSPKFRFLDLGYIGTPDGTIDTVTREPKTYHAALVHDALYQFQHHADMPYERCQMDAMFLDLMKKSGFSMRWIYHLATRVLGAAFHWVKSLFRRYNLTY